jgi:hypothetical protein
MKGAEFFIEGSIKLKKGYTCNATYIYIYTKINGIPENISQVQMMDW